MKATRNYTGACLVANQFDSALYYSKINLEDAQKFKDSLAIGIAFFNLGISYRFLADMEMAVKYSLDGARILEAKGQKNIAAQVNEGLQVLYMTMGQYDKAILYGEKSVQQARELKNNEFLSISLNNLALSYMEIDSLTEKAKQVLEESIQASKAIENFSAMAAAYNNLSGIAINQEKFELAAVYARKALALNEQLNSDETKAVSLRALSFYYLHTKDFTTAKMYADSSFD
jgi:tetratricopeptide (TPR) repeat protein